MKVIIVLPFKILFPLLWWSWTPYHLYKIHIDVLFWEWSISFLFGLFLWGWSSYSYQVGTHAAAAAAAAKSFQSCLTLCNPIDGSPSGSSIPGILQARTLEWFDISFSNAWKWEVKVKSLSHVRLVTTPWTAAYQAPPSMGFSRLEYWSGVPLPSLVGTHDMLEISPWLVYKLQKFGKLAVCRNISTNRTPPQTLKPLSTIGRILHI